MNQVDLFIIVVLGFNIYYGATRGALRGLGDMAALFAALGLGSLVYFAPAAILGAVLGWAPVLCDLAGFIISAVAIAVGTGYLFGHIAERRKLPPLADHVGGGAAGTVIGAVLASLLLLLSGTITGTTRPIDRSWLAKPLLQVVPAMHLAMDRVGLPIPKLVLLPPRYEQELGGMRYGPQFMRLNFARLENSTCIKCRGRLRFVGYKRVFGSRLAPKLVCRRCARTTDGCQSFEGMHVIYDECPVLVARRGVKLNCGVWPNPDAVYPRGRCPVDGNTFTGVTTPSASLDEESPLDILGDYPGGRRPLAIQRRP
ncbi:MAG: CvpA family protein [Armatimonadota bacterium]|nr:MAG: CvpA family protein [Armatimonadota bacterium]